MSIFSRKTEVQVPLQDHTIYLIDTENVRTVWTLLLDRMTLNDKIYVFYTMNSGNVSYEDLNGVISSGKNVELIQCHTGKNGLDFQLVSFLGYLIRDNENADYCIISDDSGYDAVIKFWEGREVKVSRKTAFQISGKQARAPKKPLFGVKTRSKTQTPKPAPAKTLKPAETAKPETPVKQASPKPQPAPKKAQEEKTQAEPKKPAAKKPAEKKPVEKKPAPANAETPKKAPKAVPKEPPKETPKETKQASPSVKVSEDKLKEFLPDESEERIKQIKEIIKKSGGKKGLADIHDEIEKIYRNEKASDIYRIIRHNIKDICC